MVVICCSSMKTGEKEALLDQDFPDNMKGLDAGCAKFPEVLEGLGEVLDLADSHDFPAHASKRAKVEQPKPFIDLTED